MNDRVYEYDEMIHAVPDKGGAYLIFPYVVRVEFHKGLRSQLHLTVSHTREVLSIWESKMKMAVSVISLEFEKISVKK